MNEELVKKLRYKEGPAMVINAPEGYKLGIESKTDQSEKYEFVQLFVSNRQELIDWLPKVFSSLKEDALFWITYPKQTSKIKTDINRDIIFEILQNETDYRVVSNVAVDEKWSALRVRHIAKVKPKK